MTEKRQNSQGYIIRILQHFATKLWNITNFVMLFQAVMKFLSRLVEIKMLSITQVVNWLHFMNPDWRLELQPGYFFKSMLYFEIFTKFL